MAANQLKQSLWFMRELLQASPYGISREDLCSKWAVSSMNDYPGEEISERTFHRIRRLLEDTFQITIECSKDGYNRYRLSAEDLTPGRPSLLDIVLYKARVVTESADTTSSLRQIASLLTSGSGLSAEDNNALDRVVKSIRKLPYECGERLIKAVTDGEIVGADNAEWDWDYKYYVMLWDEETFQRTRQWLSVGICPNGILFYIVTDEVDADLRERRAKAVGASMGVMYRRRYWWHEMENSSMFQLPYSAVPDYDGIVKRSEEILSRLSAVNF